MADVSTITANGVTYNIKDTVARAGLNNTLTISVGAFSSFPKTISNANITADHVVLEMSFGNPNALTSDVGWTTSAGQIVLTGTISGSTTAQIVLGKSAF